MRKEIKLSTFSVRDNNGNLHIFHHWVVLLMLLFCFGTQALIFNCYLVFILFLLWDWDGEQVSTPNHQLVDVSNLHYYYLLINHRLAFSPSYLSDFDLSLLLLLFANLILSKDRGRESFAAIFVIRSCSNGI